MNSRKTNNTYLKNKIILRLLNLPEKENIKVLDCFHGDGIIWKNIKYNSEKNIIINAIDIDSEYDDFALIGDNIKILQKINLSGYDIIDLDAWGLPDKQIDIIIKRAIKGTIIFFTFIQSVFGQLSNNILLSIGISEIMFNKCRTIFNRKGFQFFIAFLSKKGIKKIKYIKCRDKYYGCFIL